jgi:hypothetical protein
MAADVPGNHQLRPERIWSRKGKVAVSSFSSSSRPRRSRRRLATWLAFGAAGLATGAVWATGFASVTGANGTAAASPVLTKTAPAAATSALSGAVTAVTPLAFAWQGRWGSIAADTVMFKVDLSGSDYNGKTYNLAVLLTNTSVLTGWASMQLQIERVDEAASGSCTAADLDGTNHPQVLNFDDEDAGIYWNGVAGDAVYCLGLASSPGDDLAGTFLRAAQDTPPTAFPTFVTTVDRAS